MGILSSAYSWFQDKVNSTFGATPPANMSLNTNNTSLGTPIKFDLSNPDPIKVYNPLINGITDAVKNGISINKDDLTSPKATPPTGGHSAQEMYYAPVPQIDYLNAELAKHYGMSKETAYQEALSNTAYQRSMKDMQAAGLNPAVIYGAGKGSPADGVYSVRDGSSGGGSGGSRGRSGGSSKDNDKLFDKGQYYGISAAAGLAAALVTGHASNYYIGSTVAQSLMSAANSLFKK